MPLTKTIAHVKVALPKLVANQSDLLPDFFNAEYKHIVPLIGQTFYDALVDAAEAETLDADETKVVQMIRKVVVGRAYFDEFGLYVVTFKNSGATQNVQGGTEPVRGWQANEAKSSLMKIANDATEVLLDFLFTNKDLFPEWTASTEYTKLASLLIRTGSEFTYNYTLYQPQRTFFIMKSVVADVQEMFLEEAIGRDLLVYLRDKGDPVDGEKEALRLLRKALAFYSVMKACEHFNVLFADYGFTILGEKSMNTIEQQQNQVTDLRLLEMKLRACDVDGGAFLEKARSYLVDYYSDGAVNAFKTEFDKGPLVNFIKRDERTSGNESRKIFDFS